MLISVPNFHLSQSFVCHVSWCFKTTILQVPKCDYNCYYRGAHYVMDFHGQFSNASCLNPQNFQILPSLPAQKLTRHPHMTKSFWKWAPLLLLPLATLYYLEPWWRKRSKRHLFSALNVKMAPMRPYFTQTNVHPIAIQSSHFHVSPLFLFPLRMRLEWKTVWLFYLPCFDLSILLQNTLTKI